MSNLEFLVYWCFFATFVFSHANGRFIHNRSARSSVQPDIQVILPTSMTDGGSVSNQSSVNEILIATSKSYGIDCPSSAALLRADAPVYARSSCLWYYELQNDPDRFPTSLPVAISKCDRQCLGLNESIRDNFICDYVYHDLTVLRKEYHDNVIHFVERVEYVPVESTCVRKKEIRQP